MTGVSKWIQATALALSVATPAALKSADNQEWQTVSIGSSGNSSPASNSFSKVVVVPKPRQDSSRKEQACQEFAEESFAEDFCCNNDSNFYFSAELLFLKFCRHAPTGSWNETPPFKSYFLRHTTTPGYRLAASWTPGCGSDLRARYTYFDSKASSNQPSFISSGDYIWTTEFSETIKWHQVDVEMELFSVFTTCSSSLKAMGGVRWIRLYKEITSQEVPPLSTGVLVSPTLTILEANFRSREATDGVGFTFHLEAEKTFTSWSLRPTLGFSILSGQVDGSLYASPIAAPYSSGPLEILLLKTDHHNQALGSIEGSLVVDYTFDLFCRDWTASFGVEAAHWLGLGSYDLVDYSYNIIPAGHAFEAEVTFIGWNLGISTCF